MKKVLGIFRGFPGLGRVVAGVSLLETLRDHYSVDIRMISYMQGNVYLASKGYNANLEASSFDISSIGLVPTNSMGVVIHKTIKEFHPDLILIDGEPLILQSIKISHPNIPIVALLNPSDLENESNDKEAMQYFRSLYSLADLQIIHGLRQLDNINKKSQLSINTILRHEILSIVNMPKTDIFCLLGGGTVNVGKEFWTSTMKIANSCIELAERLPDYKMHIVCSDSALYHELIKKERNNILIYENIINAKEYYKKASLILTRAGRNTLSELLFLGIPSAAFISGCSYRKHEQAQNIADLAAKNIVPAFIDEPIETLEKKCRNLLSKSYMRRTSFEPGNDLAISAILNLLNCPDTFKK